MSFRRAILATCIGLAGCASQPTLLRWSKASGTTEVAPPTLYVTSQPADPATLAAVAILLSVVMLMACWLPAYRATRIAPVDALRRE